MNFSNTFYYEAKTRSPHKNTVLISEDDEMDLFDNPKKEYSYSEEELNLLQGSSFLS
jgi:hypothetical protein